MTYGRAVLTGLFLGGLLVLGVVVSGCAPIAYYTETGCFGQPCW